MGSVPSTNIRQPLKSKGVSAAGHFSGYFESVAGRSYDECIRMVRGSEPQATRLRFTLPEHNWVVPSSRFGLDLRPVFGRRQRERYRRGMRERQRQRERDGVGIHASSSGSGGELAAERESLEFEKEEFLSQVRCEKMSFLPCRFVLLGFIY